jgi:hypothetical protein
MALRVQGIASPERAAIAAGTTPSRLSTLTDAGLAEEREGRVCGFALTALGAELVDELLAAEGLRGDPELTACYERFLAFNERVLKLSTDWQVRRAGGTDTPNDHSDPHHDALVIDRLAELHERIRLCLDTVATRAPRFASYRSRLDDCVTRLQNGDLSAFTAVMAESYHTVWFELHQDLLLTLGLKRGT